MTDALPSEGILTGGDDSQLPVTIRLAKERDLNYVRAVWKQALHRACYPFCPNGPYYDWANPLIDAMADTGEILVATNPSDPDQAVGFIVMHKSRLLFLYTKKTFRRLGVARRLLFLAGVKDKDATRAAAFMTPDLAKIVAKGYAFAHTPQILKEFQRGKPSTKKQDRQPSA